MIAEHGSVYKSPGENQWHNLSTSVFEQQAKQETSAIIQKYIAITPGSFIETKKQSLVWHYRNSKPVVYCKNSQALYEELNDKIKSPQIGIRHGEKIIEVYNSNVSKGDTVNYFVAKNNFSYILCVGDDSTDESMFTLDHKNLISVKIGKGKTHAKLRLNNPKKLREHLIKLVGT